MPLEQVVVMRTGSRNNPSTPSGDYEKMSPYWKMVKTITGGKRAMEKAGEEYLPKFSEEADREYKMRLKHIRFTNVFGDILSVLASKPFQEQVKLTEETDNALEEFAEDVSGSAESLHVFLGNVFDLALRDGITWILVDYTQGIPDDVTVAQEQELGARPYWCIYEALDVISVRSRFAGGVEMLTEVRIREREIEPDGFSEKATDRIRIFRHDPGMKPTWETWIKVDRKAGSNVAGEEEWVIEQEQTTLDLEKIPMVPVILGRRIGKSWALEPPLRDAAELQIELYQQENGLKNIRNMTAFPMLAANGIEPPTGEDGNPSTMTVGPSAVLWSGVAPDGGRPGNWAYVEPSGQSLQFLREDIKDTIKELRELGRQPLTAQSGNLTVITTAFAASKGNTAVHSWVGLLENSAIAMMQCTADWLDMPDAEVGIEIFSDFDIGLGNDESFKFVLELAGGEEQMISRDAVIAEAIRRGILSANYDADEDAEKILRSVENEGPENDPAEEPEEEPEEDPPNPDE